MKLSEEEYLKECLKLLDCFGKDYSGDTIMCNSGDYSIICNPKSEFHEVFGGHSVWDVCEYVARKLNKKVVFINEDY